MELNVQIEPRKYIRSIRVNPGMRKFPNFRDIMSKWEDLLMNHYQGYIHYYLEAAQSGIEPDFEDYGLEVKFGSGYFTFIWNISKMAEYITENNMKPEEIPAKVILDAVYEEALHKNFTPKHPENPIIFIADINNKLKPLCINGNHRIKKTATENGNQKLGVYSFKEDSHTQFMLTKFQELFWKFLIDMKRIEWFVNHPNPPFQPGEIANNLYLYREA
ncbi:hypothetical protein [Peribacillus sp. TH27]|uniref:hypothetical protein n=1 Tax=Peribacillus sp. TH27 TaxID=2798484 RepID=UPI001914756C|nr:hypothetical protein [Peribacillus sp. TH27]MBK5458924.1 hypothetical protein [Peribacillus sp. TH27]